MLKQQPPPPNPPYQLTGHWANSFISVISCEDVHLLKNILHSHILFDNTNAYHWKYNGILPEFCSVSNTRRINMTPLRVKTAIARLGDDVTVFSNIPRRLTTPEE